jgi:ABC-2 type transport system ATP-binding protein
MDAIQTIHLTKKYKDVTAVDRLNLHIRQGELFALLGVNGAGKTTTIKMLSGLTRPDSGDALVGGYSIVRDVQRVKSVIGVSPQETAVAPNLSVQENLTLMCGIYGFPKQNKMRKSVSWRRSSVCSPSCPKKPASCPEAGSAGSVSPWH